MNITTAELLDALEKAHTQSEEMPPHTYSGTEIMQALGVGHAKFAVMMRRMLADGSAKTVQVRKLGLDGRLCRVTNYQFAVPPKLKKLAKR